jgi:hypothetical protein
MQLTPELLRGAAEVEVTPRGLRPHRLPAWVREQFPDGQLLSMESQPSGVRVVFRTTATAVDLVTHPTRIAYPGAERPRGRIDVYAGGELAVRDVLDGGDRIEVDLTTGQTTFHPGEPHTTTVSGLASGPHRIEIWLPHNETLELIELRADAPIEADDTRRALGVHHGSSISHGSNATHPTGTWPALAAAQAGVELVNLGFGGSAFLQPFIARTIRDTPADLISVKLGINIVNADSLRLRSFTPAVHGFLDTIRDGHPDTPLLVVSPILCPIHEDTPGPTGWDLSALAAGELRFVATGNPDEIPAGKLTLSVIRAELARITAQRAASDPNLHYLDGRTLYGEADNAEHPLSDDLHPGPETHESMAARFTEHVFKDAFSG